MQLVLITRNAKQLKSVLRKGAIPNYQNDLQSLFAVEPITTNPNTIHEDNSAQVVRGRNTYNSLYIL